ncbi:MAG TPA: hemolysin family protein [Mariprofundaceae bacterium]|nr:hemolysin family protein [Mariprofundaceae bacterium]
MFEQWRERVRRYLLQRLRPGRDEAELLELLGRAEAVQSDEHRRMLERLAVFHDVRVRELMVPRSEIRALSVKLSLNEAARQIAEHDFSKVPVFDGDLDHIRGLVHVWDVFSAQVRGERKSLAKLLRPSLKVPESQLVLGLLTRMKQEGVHLAIVMDEYGGTGGLVTLSDLLAEIVGPLDGNGESEDAEECVQQPDGSCIVQGRMHVEDLEKAVGLKLPEGDYDTVAGLIISQCGRIPGRGERLEIAGLVMHVMDADPRRVMKVRVEPVPPSAER